MIPRTKARTASGIFTWVMQSGSLNPVFGDACAQLVSLQKNVGRDGMHSR